MIGSDTDELDLDGKLVVPGLIDSHIHPVLVAGASGLVLMPFTNVYHWRIQAGKRFWNG